MVSYKKKHGPTVISYGSNKKGKSCSGVHGSSNVYLRVKDKRLKRLCADSSNSNDDDDVVKILDRFGDGTYFDISTSGDDDDSISLSAMSILMKGFEIPHDHITKLCGNDGSVSNNRQQSLACRSPIVDSSTDNDDENDKCEETALVASGDAAAGSSASASRRASVFRKRNVDAVPVTSLFPSLDDKKSGVVRCSECGETEASIICTECHAVSYCSRACQLKSLKLHKMICPNVKIAHAPRPVKTVLAFFFAEVSEKPAVVQVPLYDEKNGGMIREFSPFFTASAISHAILNVVDSALPSFSVVRNRSQSVGEPPSRVNECFGSIIDCLPIGRDPVTRLLLVVRGPLLILKRRKLSGHEGEHDFVPAFVDVTPFDLASATKAALGMVMQDLKKKSQFSFFD
jgi:hypothetical protein